MPRGRRHSRELLVLLGFGSTSLLGIVNSFSAQNPVWLMPQARQICGGLSLRMVPPRCVEVVIITELEKRLEQYLQSDDFQTDIGALVNDYWAQGLPVPPEEQLREEAAAEARKCLETMMICEAKGHLWKEKDADPENGTSTLSCRRCGAEEHLRW